METEATAAISEQDTRETELTASMTGFVVACIHMRIHEHMTPAPAALWDAGLELLGDEGSTQTRIGYVLALDALAQSPEALAAVAADIRARLVDAAPGLEGLKR